MTCRQCSGPLAPRQTRRGYLHCSHACANAAARREYVPRWCERCRLPLTHRQLRDDQRFCSHRCSQMRAPKPARAPVIVDYACRAVIAVLEANCAWWITYADLAFWCHGDDGPAQINAVKSTVYRLRQRGYRFHVRRVGWPTLERQYITGLRLADEPVVREVRAA